MERGQENREKNGAEARQGKERKSKARQGKARQDKVRQGKARQWLGTVNTTLHFHCNGVV